MVMEEGKICNKIRTIEKKGTPLETQWLCNILFNSRNETERIRAALALRKVGDNRSKFVLIEVVEKDQSVLVISHSIDALERFSDDRNVLDLFRRVQASVCNKKEKLNHHESLYCSKIGDILSVGPPNQYVPDFQNTLNAVLKKCETGNYSANYELEKLLKKNRRNFSDKDLYRTLNLKDIYEGGGISSYKYTKGQSVGGFTYSFSEARNLAFNELMHRWAVHPFWQLGRFDRLLYIFKNGRLTRPQYPK